MSDTSHNDHWKFYIYNKNVSLCYMIGRKNREKDKGSGGISVNRTLITASRKNMKGRMK